MSITEESYTQPIQTKVVSGGAAALSKPIIDDTSGLITWVLKTHQRYQLLQEWLGLHPENLEWYEEQVREWKFALVEGWIMILWDTLDSEDEEGKFTFDEAQVCANKNDKKITDWDKYMSLISSIPWINDENKVNFLTKVLWLKFNGYKVWINDNIYSWISAFYWSFTNLLNPNLNFNCFKFIKNKIKVYKEDKKFYFSLRLCRKT